MFLRPKARAQKASSVLGADLRHLPDGHRSEAAMDAAEQHKRNRSREFSKKHKRRNASGQGIRNAVSELGTQLSARVSQS